MPTPSRPGRYELRLEPRDAGGWPLPAVDRVTIPGVEVRVWAAQAVSYAIEPSPDGSGAVVRITNTGRVAISASSGTPAAMSNNPEVVPARSIITVAAAGGPADPASLVLRAVPLPADLAPGASIAVNVPGVAAATGRTTSWLSASVSVLDDPTWLGATATGGAWVHASASPAQVPTPAPTPTPAPSPAPKPKPAPKPAPRPKPPVITTYGERSGAIRYRGGWADASGSGYLGGHVAWSRTPGATATFTFTGSSVAWIGPVGPTRGLALVRIDGRAVARISLWRASFDASAVRYRRSFRTSGRHSITIEVLRAPGHPVIAIDAFRVRRTSAGCWCRAAPDGERGRGQLAGASASGSAASAVACGAGAARRHLGRRREVDRPDAPGPTRLGPDERRGDDPAGDRLDDRGLTRVQARPEDRDLHPDLDPGLAETRLPVDHGHRRRRDLGRVDRGRPLGAAGGGYVTRRFRVN